MASYFIDKTQIALIDMCVSRIDEDDGTVIDHYNAVLTFDKDGYSSALDPNSPHEPYTIFDNPEHERPKDIYDAIKYFVEWIEGDAVKKLVVRIIFEDGYDWTVEDENVDGEIDVEDFIDLLREAESYKE